MTQLHALKTQEVSTDDIRFHYDLNNDFYRLWLGESMTYTCALYEEGDTLAQAQYRKIDYLVELAKAKGAARVLDIGCGWGPISQRLVNQHGVGQATAVTVSKAQGEWIRALKNPKIDLHIESWSAHRPTQPYDAIIACGLVEAVSRRGLRPKERVSAYRAFFQHCHSMLKPGGSMAIQTISFGNAPLTRELARDVLFIETEIFPDSEVPRLAHLAEGSEMLFEMVTLRNDRLMYAKTCAQWLQGLRDNRAEAVALVGEENVARYDRFLDVCVQMFEGGQADLLRIGFKRVG